MLQLSEPLTDAGTWNSSRLPDYMGLRVGNSPKRHKFTQQGCVLLCGIIKRGTALGELKQNVAQLDNERMDTYSLISNLNTGFSWFPCVYKRMPRWFPSFQVATTCLLRSPPELNFLVTSFFHICLHVK